MENVSPQGTKRNIWSYLGVFGAFLMVLPLLALLFVGIVITPLFKTDGDLGIGVFLLLAGTATPLGLVLIITGLIGSFLTKK